MNDLRLTTFDNIQRRKCRRNEMKGRTFEVLQMNVATLFV